MSPSCSQPQWPPGDEEDPPSPYPGPRQATLSVVERPDTCALCAKSQSCLHSLSHGRWRTHFPEEETEAPDTLGTGFRLPGEHVAGGTAGCLLRALAPPKVHPLPQLLSDDLPPISPMPPAAGSHLMWDEMKDNELFIGLMSEGRLPGKAQRSQQFGTWSWCSKGHSSVHSRSLISGIGVENPT